MAVHRRRFLALSTVAAAAAAAPAQPARAGTASLATLGMEASQFGVRAGSPSDQSRVLQIAIERAAAARVPLVLAPGVYRAGDLRLPAGAQVVGVRGATRIVRTTGTSLISAMHADQLTLSGLTLDGADLPLPEGRALVHLS